MNITPPSNKSEIIKPTYQTTIPTPVSTTRPLALSTPLPGYLSNRPSKEGGRTPLKSNIPIPRRIIPQNSQNFHSTGIMITEDIPPDLETAKPIDFPELPYGDSETVSITRENLTYSRSHYVHSMSSDCELITPIGNLLSNLDIINPDDMKLAKPKVGQVLITERGKHRVFSIVVKQFHGDKICVKNLTSGLLNLKNILIKSSVQFFRISHTGDFLDEFPQHTVTSLLTHIFEGSGIKVIICYGNIRVPPEPIRQNIISEFHEGLIGGHKGVTKTYLRIREKFYWPGLRNDVQNFIRNCNSYKSKKLVGAKTREPMLITDTSIEAFDKIALDTVGPLPTSSSGNRHILTMQDNLTKYCIAVPIPDIKAEAVAHALTTNLILQYGAPRVILTDRGTSFINKLMQQLATIFKIHHVTTSGYRPQTNGALERSHIVLTEYISHYIKDYDDWDRLVPFAMFSYNTSVHETTNFTPYELVFGKLARCPNPFQDENENLPIYNSYLQDLIIRLSEMQTLAGNNLIKAKEKSKVYYDKSARPFKGKLGDMVRVQVEPKRGKFGERYHGPYRIVRTLEGRGIVLEDDKGKFFTKHPDKLILV